MEQGKDKVYAYFWITDFDCDFSEISRLLDLQPSRAGNKGEKVRTGTREHGFWELHSPLPRSDLLIDRHLGTLLGMIEPRREILGRLRNLGYTVGVNCVGYFTGNPGFHLSADLITRCASLSLSLDFDLYCLADNES